MEALVTVLAELRRQIIPRTSYNTCGSAASDLLVSAASFDGNPSLLPEYTSFSQSLLRTGEFTNIPVISSLNSIQSNVYVIFVTSENDQQALLSVIEDVLHHHRTKLFFVLYRKAICSEEISKKIDTCVSKMNSKFQSKQQSFRDSDYILFSIFEPVVKCLDSFVVIPVSDLNKLGFNGQNAVQSRKQFRMIFESKNTDFKVRLLSRLSNHHPKSNRKMSTDEWNSLIMRMLKDNKNDFDIYSTIRKYVLNISLEDTLLLPVVNDVPGADNSQHDSSEEGGDGRSRFMVDRILESVPQSLLPTKSTGPNTIKRVLDYGCAEGKITAVLASVLKLPPSNVFGADIRVIPSTGFTFLHLKTETNQETDIENTDPLFPQIEDGSIDLIVLSMVMHHVKHPNRVLLELRRILSPTGCLCLREHHCDSATSAAFLDIVHGLYSLAWSDPIEWPNFLQEYEAYYRSREEWTKLLESCGLLLIDPQTISNDAARSFNSVNQSGITNKGVKNDIRAYNACYKANMNFKPPVSIVKPKAVVLPASATDSKKRDLSCLLTASESEKKTKLDDTVELFESKKHPGNFYYVDPIKKSTHWVEFVDGSTRQQCRDVSTGKIYHVSKLN